MQLGYERRWWPTVLVKELIDNALDACETAEVSPKITVTVKPDSVIVEDNGPGLPEHVIERSLDYSVRVSDKHHYISPTRGQLGNALKCVWAAPFVADGEVGRIVIAAGDRVHVIRVSLNRIAQEPRIRHRVRHVRFVKTGTKVKIRWPEIASLLDAGQPVFYDRPSVYDLIRAFATANPHAEFILEDRETITVKPTNLTWRKWTPTDPTSPHWYNEDRLTGLVAANLAEDRRTGNRKTLRAFISEFSGLSGAVKQKRVASALGSTSHLDDLVDMADEIDAGKIHTLLQAMRSESRPIKPRALGAVGEAHLRHWLVEHCNAEPGTITYKKAEGMVDGLPFIVEAAFGIYAEEYLHLEAQRFLAFNWSPTLKPVSSIVELLGENRVDSFDPVVVWVHVICPRLDFTDRGKTTPAFPDEIRGALKKVIMSIAKRWKRIKRNADREDRAPTRKGP